MGIADLVVSYTCEAKPSKVEGKHSTPGWLGRVPVADVPAVVRFLRSRGVKPRVIYRDKSADRPKRYARGRFYTSGWSLKSDATHADIYDNPPRDEERDGDFEAYVRVRDEASKLTALKAALIGKKTDDPALLDLIVSEPEWAYRYAKNAIKGPWERGEDVMKDTPWWDKYIEMVLKSALNGKKTDDPTLLDLIASKPEWAYRYAKNAIKGPWTKGEEVMKGTSWWKKYVEMVDAHDPETGPLYTGDYL